MAQTATSSIAAAKVVDGKKSAPTMFGDQGFYSFKPGNYNLNFLEIYALSMKPSDRARCRTPNGTIIWKARIPAIR